MKRALAVSMVMLAAGSWTASAVAAEKKSFIYVCRDGTFTVVAVVDSSGRWSRSEPVVLRLGEEPAQILVADPDAPDADSYRNKDYEFYSLGTFTTLTRKSHGVTVKFYNDCRAPDVR